MKLVPVTLLLLCLTAIRTDGRKKSSQHGVAEMESKVNENKNEKPRVPFGFTFGNPFGLALQIPIISPDVFGNLQNQMKKLREAVYTGGAMSAGKNEQLYDENGKKLKVKTRTRTSNSTHGPLKTYTIEKETVSTENKTNPKVISKSIQSISVLDNKFKKKLSKEEKEKMRKMLFKFGPMQLSVNELDEKPPCKTGKCSKGKYCDRISGQCADHRPSGAACTQDGQCRKELRCTWGRCIVNSIAGSAGTFCKDESNCRPDSRDTEMLCDFQPDISHFTKVCIPRLSEGATCGHASIFDMFHHSAEENVCKKGLECRRIGLFTGRKICVKSAVAKSIDDASRRSDVERPRNMDKMDEMDSMNAMEQPVSMYQMK